MPGSDARYHLRSCTRTPRPLINRFQGKASCGDVHTAAAVITSARWPRHSHVYENAKAVQNFYKMTMLKFSEGHS